MEKVHSLQVAALESAFRQNFCSMKSTYCNSMWTNGKLLIQKLLADNRIEQIEIEAYMFATALVETGNLSPAAREVPPKHPHTDYWLPAPNGQVYYGRGWSQITRIDRYKLAKNTLKIDFVNDPDLTLDPTNSYEILFLGMRDGWFEVFRNTPMGQVVNARKTPARIGDFINNKNSDYKHARAVINANCMKNGDRCKVPDIEYRTGLFIPDQMDAWNRADQAAIHFQTMICMATQSVGKNKGVR